MIAGFLPLLFNPQAWIAVGLAFVIGFSGGVFKGWADSNAEHYQQQVSALREAADNKERLAQANARRAEAAEAERHVLQQSLEALINETNSEGNACVFSDRELDRLRGLAAGNG